jgi:nicotinamide riboside transporter PnuC
MINWIMASFALTGTILNIRKIRSGFLFWMISNSYWMIYNFYIKEYAQSLLYFVFLGLSFWGFFSWSTEEIEDPDWHLPE